MKYLKRTLGLCLTYSRGTPLFSFLRAEFVSCSCMSSRVRVAMCSDIVCALNKGVALSGA